MDEKNKRFRTLRIKCGKTQGEWADILGITRQGISSIENGRRKVTEKHIRLLSAWKELQINPNWLRTGDGDVFLTPPKNSLVANAASLLGERDPLLEALIETYSKLSPANREAVQKFGRELLKQLLIEQKEK